MKLNLSNKLRTYWPWLLGLFILLLASASIYTAVWYHGFYHHVTVQELSPEVNHSDLKLRTYWPWLLGLFILLLASASIYTAVWYHGFYHHVTVQELSHEVNHSTFQATIRGGSSFALHLYQQANASAQPLVLFTSGDGGWSPFCADIAAHIASSGKTVVGFN